MYLLMYDCAILIAIATIIIARAIILDMRMIIVIGMIANICSPPNNKYPTPLSRW